MCCVIKFGVVLAGLVFYVAEALICCVLELGLWVGADVRCCWFAGCLLGCLL